MSLSVVSITLNIRNNRTYPQRINVLGSPVNPLDTANALTEYRWDVTAYAPSPSDTLTLEYKPVGASVFSIFTYELSNANSEALVSALNTLGIGYFNYYTELGQNYLSTNNDNYVFNTLTINNNLPPTPTTSTTTTTTTAAPTTSTTTTTTTAAPTTSTTTTTTTAAPTTTSTTTTTTTAAPTTTSTTTTTTTAAPELFALAYSVVGGDAACGTYPTTNNYYASSGSILQNGTILYTDSALTTPAPVGYYSNGVNWWYISGAGLAGELSSETICTSPTTTSTTTTTTTAVPTTTTTTSTTTTTTTAGSVENFRSVTPQLNSGNACAQSAPTSIYTSLSESTMANGITFYSDAALTTPFDGNSQWFKIFWKGAVGFDDVYGVQIDSNGVVLSFVFCPTTTTSTTTTTTTAPITTSTTTTTTTLATCASATIVISQTDIDNSDDGIVHAVYTACNGGGVQDTPYTIAGTYVNDLCYDTNFDPVPTFYYIQGGNPQTITASYATYNGACNITTTTTTTTTTAGSVENFRSVTPQVNVGNACAQSAPTSIYTSLSESTMANGITFYSDAALTTPFNGNSQWFKIFWKGAVGFDDVYGVQIDSSGVVLSFSFCPSTTTTTTTSTTSTTTTAPPTTTTTTTSTTTTLFTNLSFDATTGVGGYTIGGIDVNNVVPTLTGGTDVPFSTDSHFYNTDQVGTNETLNIFVSVFSLNGCITVTDSASNVFQQNITGTGTYSFAGIVIDNITAVQVICADNVC